MKHKRALPIILVVVLLLALFAPASAQGITQKDTTPNQSYVGGQLINLTGRIKITMTTSTSAQVVLHLPRPVDFKNISTTAGTASYIGETQIQLQLSPARGAANFKKKYHNKDVSVTGRLMANPASSIYTPATKCYLAADSGGSVQVSMLKKPRSIKISGEAHELEQSKTMPLSAVIKPDNALQMVKSWSSSNKKVATVDANGVVTGVWKGTCYITGKTINGKSARWKVKVFLPATGISISETAITLTKGKTKTLKATVQPAGTGGGLIWGTDNLNVATITAKGVVKAISPGTAIITVKTYDRQFEAYCTVTVPGASDAGDPRALSVRIANNALLGVGATKQASVALDPAGAKMPTITWYSSNPAVATVDSAGLITGKAVGATVIEARSNVLQQGKAAPVGGATVIYVTADPKVSVPAMSSADFKIAYKTASIQLPVGRDAFAAAVPGFKEDTTQAEYAYYGTDAASGVNFAYWYSADGNKTFKGFNTYPGDTAFATNRGIAGGATPENMVSKYGAPGNDLSAVTINYTCDSAGKVTAVSYNAYATYYVGAMYLRFHLDLAAQKLDQFTIR